MDHQFQLSSRQPTSLIPQQRYPPHLAWATDAIRCAWQARHTKGVSYFQQYKQSQNIRLIHKQKQVKYELPVNKIAEKTSDGTDCIARCVTRLLHIHNGRALTRGVAVAKRAQNIGSQQLHFDLVIFEKRNQLWMKIALLHSVKIRHSCWKEWDKNSIGTKDSLSLFANVVRAAQTVGANTGLEPFQDRNEHIGSGHTAAHRQAKLLLDHFFNCDSIDW